MKTKRKKWPRKWTQADWDASLGRRLGRLKRLCALNAPTVVLIDECSMVVESAKRAFHGNYLTFIARGVVRRIRRAKR